MSVFYMLENAEKYLYHYTKAKALAEIILPTGRLRFSRFETLNDPREAKDWVLGVYTRASDVIDNFESIKQTANRIMKRNCRVGCFITDVDEALGTRKQELEGKNVIDAMWERGHSRPRMWYQYGENFTGACLIFDREKLDKKIQTAAHIIGATVSNGKIVYKNPPGVPNLFHPDPMMLTLERIHKVGIESAIREHIRDHLSNLFFLKSTDWEQEREYRWVIHDVGEDEFFVSFEDALVGVLLGDKFPTNQMPSVGKYCLEHGSVLGEMKWTNGFPTPMPLSARHMACGGYSEVHD